MPVFKTAALALGLALAAFAAHADSPPLKIGVLTDESGPFVDSGGPGSVAAAEMAAQDFGGEVLGRKIEIVHADTLNKPDVAAGVARRWFEVEGVSAITDLPVTPVAFAVQALAKEKNRTVLITAGATTDITAKYLHDRLLALGRRQLRHGDQHRQGGDRRRREDLVFPHRRHRVRRRAAKDHDRRRREAAGGKVLGSVKYPINAPDFSSLLLQAQASGADRIGLASVGGDLDNQIKQGAEFGIGRDGKQAMVGFLVYIQDVHALGLQAAQNLNLTLGLLLGPKRRRARLRQALLRVATP